MTAAARAALAAAAVVLAVNITEPFEHGGWLLAYLVLVGFLAQLLLALGQMRLLAERGLPALPRRVRVTHAVLWNVGVVAVPVGVLADVKVAIVAGSISLVAALVSLTRMAWPVLIPALGRRSRLGWGYAALLAAMAFSTLIGTALAWDVPWT